MMTEAEHTRREAVDAITLVLLIPFCFWLGWWGVLPAFAIGTAINIWASKKDTP